MAAKDKDTIYIDIDDEITGIIDKLQGSDGKVVALVLPKRATTFQSIVNMKLLKRAADASKKHLVLITAEAGLLPLAGAAGIHVARTLTSKPEIPLAPAADDSEETVQEEEIPPAEPLPDKSKSIGQLADESAAAAAPAAASSLKPPADGVETVTLDDDELPSAAAAKSAVKPGPKGAKTFEPPDKGKKNKKLRVPNFNRFRKALIIFGVLIVLVIIAFLFATFSLPKATIDIQTDATNVDTNLTFSLSPGAKKLDPVNAIVPAKQAQQQKTYTEQVPTTGQKNNGNRASGNVTVTNCGSSDVTIPAGTGFSASGNTYISEQPVTVPVSDFKGFNGHCENDGQATVEVQAQSPGSGYNLPSGANFSIAGNYSGLSAQGNTISGGTDDIVQTVNQNDINNAKSKVSTNNDQFKQTLENQLKAGGYYPIPATFQTGTPDVTPSANVGDVANSVTVTETVTYTMLGAPQGDLDQLITNQVDTQIDTGKQTVLSTGLGKASFSVNTISASGAQLTMTTTATAGPQLDTASIKQQAAGQRSGAIKGQLQNNPDVTSVNVSISPFWVSTAPKDTKRITVNIAKPTTTKSSNGHGSNP